MKSDNSVSGRRETAATADDIKIDKEFAALIPQLSKDEYAQLEQAILDEGCRDPLIVWKGKNILLDGHNRLSICREHQLPFKVNTLEFPDREAAEAFILKNQLGRRNLSPEAASFLRGKRYLAEKLSHGGDRTDTRATDQNDRLETAQRLAKEYKVGEATIRRDGKFAQAVESITENCGEKAKQVILSRDISLSRGAVLRLAKLKAKEQQKVIQELLEKGKLPRRATTKKRSTITLPNEPKSLAQKLFENLGAKGTSEVVEMLSALLKENKPKG